MKLETDEKSKNWQLTGGYDNFTVPAQTFRRGMFQPTGPGRPSTDQEGSDQRLTEIRLKKGESVEKALRRLKKRIDREGTLKEVRNHRHYEKPSERRRRKMKVARFSAMLSARYADL
jgi:small subunit ribosomal protein S21